MNTERYLSRVQSLTPGGKSWLIAALDPYHDNQLDLEGLPDQRSAPSVVQLHNQSYNLTVPTSAGGLTWDASVLWTGINTPIPVCPDGGMMTMASAGLHTFNSASLSSGMSFGALNIWAGAAGSTMTTGAPFTIGDLHTSLGSVQTTDRCRLIAVGFEIHNTTADVFKQGSLTVAQLPDCACDATNVQYVGTYSTVKHTEGVQADRSFRQACTLAPLLQVPGSSTWPASKGAYVIPRMVSTPQDVKFYGFTPSGADKGAISRVPIIYGTDGKVATPEITGVAIGAGGEFCYLFKPHAPNNFSPVQVWLSGLSNQSTLTITLRTVVEYFPALESGLLPGATPSPCYDPKALALYSAIVTEAPYAVQVGQNSAGDYFRRIARIMSEVLSSTSPLFGSYAPLAAAAGVVGRSVFSEAGPPVNRASKPVRKDEAGKAARANR